VWAVVAVALIIRLAGIRWGLPDVFEEAYPFKVAWRMWGLDGGSPTLNPHWFHYPSLMIYVQYALIGAIRLVLAVTRIAPDLASLQALYAKDPSVFYVTGRAVTSVLGALTVLPTMAIAQRAGGPRAALLAGLLVALSPALVANSQLIEVDVPLTLLVTCAVAMAIDLASRTQARAIREAALCGIALGLATSTKYPGILTAIPMAFALAMRARRTIESQAAVESWVLMGTAVVTFLATSPFVLLDSSAAIADMQAEGIHLRLGHFGSEQGAAWVYYARSWFVDALGWLAGLAAIFGLLRFAIWKREPWAVLSAAFVVPHLLVVSAWAMKADRYLLPIIPPGFIFAAALLLWSLRRLVRRQIPSIAVVGIAALCLVTDAQHWTEYASRFGPDSRTLARAWVSRSLPPGSMVVVESYGPRLASPLELQGMGPDAWRAFPTRPDIRTKYWLLPIPMFQVAPERSAVYYDPRFLPQADAWIVSGAVRDRYRAERERFPVQNAFYDWLDERWTQAARIAVKTGTGPEIVIYRNPAQQIPFGSRIVPPPPPTALMLETDGVDGESTFYYALGVNYLGFGRPWDAVQCFQYALSFRNISGGVSRTQIYDAMDRAHEQIVVHGSKGTP